jgi:hypothetical protein
VIEGSEQRPHRSEWPEVTSLVRASRDEFLGLLDLYEGDEGRQLRQTVVERLERLTNPETPRSPRIVHAARAFQAELLSFTELRIALTERLGGFLIAVDQLSESIGLEYLKQVTQAFTDTDPGEGDLHRIRRQLSNLETINDRWRATKAACFPFLAAQGIDACDECSDMLRARLLVLEKYVSITGLPTDAETLSRSHGELLKPAVRATRTEALFTVGEELLKNAPLEFAAQLPLVSLAVGVVRIANDVREKREVVREKRQMWKLLEDAQYTYNVADATLDLLDEVKADDESMRETMDALSALGAQMMEAARFAV